MTAFINFIPHAALSERLNVRPTETLEAIRVESRAVAAELFRPDARCQFRRVRLFAPGVDVEWVRFHLANSFAQVDPVWVS